MKRSLGKRIIMAVVLSVIMVLSIGASVFAATVTVDDNDENGVSRGNTYTAYKILEVDGTGEDSSHNKVYTYKATDAFKNLETEEGLSGYKYNVKTGAITDSNGTVIAETTEATNTKAYTDTAIAKFATAMSNVSEASGQDLPADLEPGYYVIVETASGSADQKEVASKPMLVCVGESNITITPKNDFVKLDKDIVEKQATPDQEEVLDSDKTNTADIGDSVPYKITTKFPTYEANVDVESLKFTLTDTFSEGLTFNDDIVIKSPEGLGKDTGYTITFDADKKELVIDFKPATINDHQGEAVEIYYSATLNENAKVDDTAGNPNNVKLEYTNNPNQENSHKTLEDKTITYTYGFNLHKVDKVAPSESLGNAEFELYTSTDKDAKPLRFSYDEGSETYTLSEDGEKTTIVSVGGENKEGTDVATIKGLDEGTYYLKETKAPDAYTKLEGDVVVTITAVKDANGKETGEAILTASGAGNSQAEGDTKVVDKDGKPTGSVESSGDTININVYVENAKGISLPETGRNTALYCMIGGVVLVIAGALYYILGARKKVSR